MESEWKMAVMEERDLACLEYLYEMALDAATKDYLLKIYKRGGRRDSYYQWQEKQHEMCLRHYSRCAGCGECGGGHPFFQSSLLEQIVCDIRDIRQGRLDPVTGEHIEEEESDLPF